MKHYSRFSFCVLLLLFLTVTPSLAVQVKGYNGTTLPLSQIPDIMRHVTGRTSSDFVYKKDSLFLYDLSVTQDRTVYAFKGNGNKLIESSLSTPVRVRPTSDFDFTNVNNVSVVATSVKRGDNEKLQLMFAHGAEVRHENGYAVIGSQLKSEGIYVVRESSSDVTIDARETLNDIVEVNGDLATSKAGIKVSGYDGELAACLIRDGAKVKLYIGEIAFEYAGIALISASWSKTLGAVPTMADGKQYVPLDMAVGDFDDDGYANEIVVVDSDRVSIHYTLLQLSFDGENFTLKELSAGEVARYNYGKWGQYYERGGCMDGIAAMFSCCVVKGDFDADGMDEFAAVWRDNSPNDIYFTGQSKYQGSGYSPHKYSMFCGYTGGIHVKIYKWNGSGFQTQEDVRKYDICKPNYASSIQQWNDIDIPLGVKAAVGDFDGDGRDDIAVLRVMLQYSEHYDYRRSNTVNVPSSFGYSNFVFGAFVDWYTFDEDSLTPKYHAHKSNYGDNGNGWVGIRANGEISVPNPIKNNLDISYYTLAQVNQNKVRKYYFLEPITGEQKPYPVIDREFQIIAGKFTGRIGKFYTCDDLAIVYPQWGDTSKGIVFWDGAVLFSNNKLRSHVALMTHIDKVSDSKTEVHEITSFSDRYHLLAMAKDDYLDESVQLGEPIKITDTHDTDYTAILQMFPYHVDNLTSDGTELTEQPQNFTLRLGTKVAYTNTAASSDRNNLEYSMTTTAETIFAVDNPVLQGTAKTFQGIRGITTAVLGNNDYIKKLDAFGAFWDKLKDSIETTKTTSNEKKNSYTMSITTQANYQDTLYLNAATRYMWRYPVISEYPPEWITGQAKDVYGSFDKSKVKKQQTFVTFVMSEPKTPTTSVGINDSNYQPFHELGNLFSYPAAIEQTEGYEGRTSLAGTQYDGPIRWNGAAFEQTITFAQTKTNQESTKKVNTQGVISKFLSAVDDVFGSNFASVPKNSEASYSRSVTKQESLNVNIPAAFSGARFTALLEPYLDIAGTTTVAFAVEKFNRDDALWGNNSLYSLKPDPALILPEKFDYTAKKDSDQDRAVFRGNDNDPTALKMRGVRFSVQDYDMETNRLLLRGLRYTISVPVYNASFKDAENFKVRLSYAKTNDYNAKKTTIGEYTFEKLAGWGNGESRQYANFSWTANVPEGIYYLFAEIDPEHVLDEVHENRRNADGEIVDYGGNNLGYVRVGVAASDSPVFNREDLLASEFSASEVITDAEGYTFPFVHWVKAGGLDLEDFVRRYVVGADRPVPVAVELDYGGEFLMDEAILVGYKLKPGLRGKTVKDIDDDDIELCFLNNSFAFFPKEDHKIHFRMNPAYLEDGVGFLLLTDDESVPLTEIIYSSAGNTGGEGESDSESGVDAGVSSGSGGGCESGFGVVAGLLALGFLLTKKER